MSKLLAYRVTGSTFNWVDGTTSGWTKIVGVELESFDNEILNGNQPYKIISDNESIPFGYVDITSIKNWATFGTGIGFGYSELRSEIKKIKPLITTGLTEQEIDVLDYYGLFDYFLIYDFLKFSYPFDPHVAPVEVDYDLGGLYKKRVFNKGELTLVEYYGNYNFSANSYSNLVVREERVYYRINQMLNRREMKISWFMNDGVTSGYEKNTTKYYTLQEAIEAGVTRRNNIVSKLKIDVIGLIQIASGITAIEAQDTARVFLDVYYEDIAKYITGFESLLISSITNDTLFQWLDLVIPNTGGITIRQYLISELTIDYTINNVYV